MVYYFRKYESSISVSTLDKVLYLSLSHVFVTKTSQSTKMCRYQVWEDDIPGSEIYEQNLEEHSNEATDFLHQLEDCMNEMREMIDSIKEINKRLKRINYFLCAFLFVLCILEGLKYFLFLSLTWRSAEVLVERNCMMCDVQVYLHWVDYFLHGCLVLLHILKLCILLWFPSSSGISFHSRNLTVLIIYAL